MAIPASARAFIRARPRTVLGLALVGALAIGLTLYLLLRVHLATPVPVTASAPLSAGTPEFVATFATVTNGSTGQGGAVTVLENGDGFLPDLLEELRTATSTVNFSTYIWKDGEFNRDVLEALTEAAGRGVAVRLLLDGYAADPPEEDLETFLRAGGEVGRFRPLAQSPLTANNRNHRRAITIDGRVGYTGGIAIMDTWLGAGMLKDEWRDAMFKVTGPLARSIDSAFADQWLVSTGEVVVARPPSPSSGNPFVNVVGSAGDMNRPIANAFLLTALSAQKTLYIANPYFLPEDALLSVITQKARDGVDVRLLVPGANTDSQPLRWAAQYYYPELLDAGVRVYEYDPTLMHKKAIVADGAWSLVGSANIDNRSAVLNDENLLGIQDPELAATLTASFMGDLEHSTEITKEAWERQGSLARAWRWVMAIPYKQY